MGSTESERFYPNTPLRGSNNLAPPSVIASPIQIWLILERDRSPPTETAIASTQTLFNPFNAVFNLLIEIPKHIQVFFTGFPITATIHLK